VSGAIKSILARDGYICGKHSGGCGKPILAIENANVDHIIPKSFVKGRDNWDEFMKSWNLQPTHMECNNKKGGQIIGTPEMQCDCHGIYIDEDGDEWIMHNEKDRGWKREKYRKGSQRKDYRNPPQENEANNSVSMIFARRGGRFGATIETGKEMGHMWIPMTFYGRMEFNCIELERPKQWKALEAESEKMAKHYETDNFASLKREMEESWIQSVAMAIYWVHKARRNIKSNKRQSRAMEKLIAQVKHKRETPYPLIKAIAEICIAGAPLRKRKYPFPFGGIIVEGMPSEAEKMMMEAEEAIEAGDIEEGKRRLDKIIEEYPRYADGLVRRAMIHGTLGNKQASLEDVSQAIELQETTSSYMIRTEVRLRIGGSHQIIESRKDIDRARDLTELDHKKHGKRMANPKTGEQMTEEEALESIGRLSDLVESREDMLKYILPLEEIRSLLARQQYAAATEQCEIAFSMYKEEGRSNFKRRMREHSTAMKAALYWTAMAARLGTTMTPEEQITRMANSLNTDGGTLIEQELSKDIYEIDLDDFVEITEEVKKVAKRVIAQAIKEGTIVEDPSQPIMNRPKLVWRLVRPMTGKK